MIVASAPGKLMIAGEYAVARALGPALAVAVGRRIRGASRSDGPRAGSIARSGRLLARLDPDGRGWRVSAAALGLREAPLERVPVLAAVADAFGRGGPSGHWIIESHLGSGPRKPGLGASAAIVAAASAALGALRGAPPGLAEMIAAHRAAQGGHGSGYDVATAYQGGVCLFEPDGTIRAARWPAGLVGAVLFTGQGSNTRRRLARLARAEARAPGAVRAALERLGEAGRELAGAWRAARSGPLLEAAEAAEATLEAFERVAGVGVGEGGQAELVDAIGSAGAVARTSGAGGGDCVWALADDPERLDAAVRAAVGAGFTRIELDLAVAGTSARPVEEPTEYSVAGVEERS